MKEQQDFVNITTENVQFSYNVSTLSTQDYNLHCHNYYEVYYFLEGSVDYLVEGQKYELEPNSILLLSPNAFHGFRVREEKPYRRIALHFSSDVLPLEHRALLLSVFPKVLQEPGQNIYFTNVEKYNISSCFDAFKACVRPDEKARDQMLSIHIEALLARLVYMCEQEKRPQHIQNLDTISEIIWYLNQNLKEEISLDQLSERFFISKHHLNKVFRKTTGTTVFDYLTRKRVSMAQHLLLNGFSAREAAAEVGFADYSAFYRAYVHTLGHAPSQDKAGTLPQGNRPKEKMKSVVLSSASTKTVN